MHLFACIWTIFQDWERCPHPEHYQTVHNLFIDAMSMVDLGKLAVVFLVKEAKDFDR